LVHALYGDSDSVTVNLEITYQDGRNASVEHQLRIETILEDDQIARVVN